MQATEHETLTAICREIVETVNDDEMPVDFRNDIRSIGMDVREEIKRLILMYGE